MGVVYHSKLYLVWLDKGPRTYKDLGFSYVEMEKEGIIISCVDYKISYR